MRIIPHASTPSYFTSLALAGTIVVTLTGFGPIETPR